MFLHKKQKYRVNKSEWGLQIVKQYNFVTAINSCCTLATQIMKRFFLVSRMVLLFTR